LVSFGEDDWYLRVYDVHRGELPHKHPIRPSRMQLMEQEDGVAYTPVTTFRLFTASAVFTPDARTLILGIANSIYWFDVESGAEIRCCELPDDYRVHEDRLAISAGGSQLSHINYVGRGTIEEPRELHIEIRDSQTGEIERTIRIVSEARAVAAFSPDDSLIVVALGGDGLHVYNVATGRKIAQIDNEHIAASAAAFTPDGERIVAAYADGSAVVWDWQEFAIER
jgi:WD40 repeat protein